MSARAKVLDLLGPVPSVLSTGRILGSLPRAEYESLVKDFCAEVGAVARLTKTRPAYSDEPGTHLLCAPSADFAQRFFWHVLHIERLTQDNHSLLVDLLHWDVYPGEWTTYTGGRIR